MVQNSTKSNSIAIQGELGAYSHQACRENFPSGEVLPCKTFEDALAATRDGDADLAMIPIENSTFGRVADVHHLLPQSGLHFIDEAYVRVHINLFGVPGAELEDIKTAYSHVMALGQCRTFLAEHGISRSAYGDTASSASFVKECGDKSQAALCSRLAGELNDLTLLAANIEDQSNNTTRFIIMAREPDMSRRDRGHGMKTSFMFQVRNIPAALYKGLGGFATNGVNMSKLESYMVDGSFNATQFFAEIEGHPKDEGVALALDELSYFTEEITVLGTYPKALP